MMFYCYGCKITDDSPEGDKLMGKTQCNDNNKSGGLDTDIVRGNRRCNAITSFCDTHK